MSENPPTPPLTEDEIARIAIDHDECRPPGRDLCGVCLAIVELVRLRARMKELEERNG